ncbi:MAG: hypothetical protein AAGC88_17165, partial [Bacteroidota bacterium]
GLFIPLLNGIQSGLWFWKSLAIGYPDSFLVDVSWLVMSVISLWAAWKAKPVDKVQKPFSESDQESVRSSANVASVDPVLTIHSSN